MNGSSLSFASCTPALFYGGLAQLARAPALQAGGQRFESVILHDENRIGEANPNLDTEAKAMMSGGSQEIFDILTQARL